MAWVIVAILAAAIALLLALYRRAMSEATHINSLLVLVLLDENVYRAQQAGLIDFAKTAPARDAMELSFKAHAALSTLAAKISESSVLGAHSFLWNVRKGTV